MILRAIYSVKCTVKGHFNTLRKCKICISKGVQQLVTKVVHSMGNLCTFFALEEHMILP